MKLSFYLTPLFITDLEAVDTCLKLEKTKIKMDFWGQKMLCVKTYEGSIPFKMIVDQIQSIGQNTKTLFREDKEAAKRIIEKLKKICEQFDAKQKQSNELVQWIRDKQDLSFVLSRATLYSLALLTSFE